MATNQIDDAVLYNMVLKHALMTGIDIIKVRNFSKTRLLELKTEH